MIEFDDVTRSYGRRVAVDGLSLTVESGELFALLGPNGAGKTTSLKLLVGLLRPDRGIVRVSGRDVVGHTREALSVVGYVPDQPFLYGKLTGREFLEFVGSMRGMSPSEAEAAIHHQSETFRLGDFLDDLTETYSHGMQQRTVFAAAVIHDPDVLVIDEPMVGLDPRSVRMVKDLLRRRVAAGMTVFMSTHTLAVAEEIADRIGIVDRGRLQFLGTVGELQQDLSAGKESLESLFLKLTDDSDKLTDDNDNVTDDNDQATATPAAPGELC